MFPDDLHLRCMHIADLAYRDSIRFGRNAELFSRSAKSFDNNDVLLCQRRDIPVTAAADDFHRRRYIVRCSQSHSSQQLFPRRGSVR